MPDSYTHQHFMAGYPPMKVTSAVCSSFYPAKCTDEDGGIEPFRIKYHIPGYAGLVPKTRLLYADNFKKISKQGIAHFSDIYEKQQYKLCLPDIIPTGPPKKPSHKVDCYRNPCLVDRKPSTMYYPQLGPYNNDYIGNISHMPQSKKISRQHAPLGSFMDFKIAQRRNDRLY